MLIPAPLSKQSKPSCNKADEDEPRSEVLQNPRTVFGSSVSPAAINFTLSTLSRWMDDLHS